MDPITELIGRIILDITIIIIGVEGVLSILNRMGFLPPPIRRAYYLRDKEFIIDSLEELGISASKPIIRQAYDYWRTETFVTVINAERELMDLIKTTTRHLEAEVGLYKKVPLLYYIDLADHTSDWKKLGILVQLICASIRKSMASLDVPIQFDKIAAPPGNPALAVFTAAQFQKPFISVTPISPLSSDPISGKIEKDDKVILVHDVVLTGYRLADIAASIRKAGGIVEHAFILVERTDSKQDGGETPSETLANNGVKLHPIISVNDNDLAIFMKR